MRSFRHWTPRYLKNRIAQYVYEKTFPDHPWLTRDANKILDSYLKKSDVGLEFGSGRSTRWIASRIQHLTSVEHDPSWYQKVRDMLNDRGVRNVNYYHFPSNADDENTQDSDYVKEIDRFEPSTLDFVLVDGIHRDICARNVIEKIRPGGLLVVDNANWYLPCKSYAPMSRTLAQGPEGPIWGAFAQSISDWRRIWTSSGITDTALFFKPCS